MRSSAWQRWRRTGGGRCLAPNGCGSFLCARPLCCIRTDPAAMAVLREKFVERCLFYTGTPYHPKCTPGRCSLA